MFFHASETAGIKVIKPSISNHEKPLVYLSSKRENTLVYLSNAVKKHCVQIGYKHTGPYKTWGSYGFNKNGVLQLEEYYPNATIETYKGVSGFIYSVSQLSDYEKLEDIPYAVATPNPVEADNCEFIPDAYEALLEAEKEDRLVLTRWEQNSRDKLNWIEKIIRSEYDNSEKYPEYRVFLRDKFSYI